MRSQRLLLFLLIASIFAAGIATFAAGTDVAVIEANIIDSQSPGGGNNSTISVQVPDFINLENVTESGHSEELQIYINNTGTGAITVTPRLLNYTDNIFQNLYFREFKTSGGNPVTPRQIGNWSVNISAPSSGSSVRSKYFYMQLDLSHADVDVSSDLIGHQANVRFFATPR